MTDRFKNKQREGTRRRMEGSRVRGDGTAMKKRGEGSEILSLFSSCQDGRSPSHQLPHTCCLFTDPFAPGQKREKKKIADTASSKLGIGSPGQVGLLTSEGSESRGGKERARQKERQQKSLL